MDILLADNNGLMREGLKAVLVDLEDGVQVVEASSADEALDHLSRRNSIGIVLLDMDLPGMADCKGVATIRARAPEIPVVVLAESGDRSSAIRALDAGAAGFLPKSLPVNVLMSALRLVLAGGSYAPPALLTGPSLNASAAGGASQFSGSELATMLTTRQLDVLSCLGQGRSNREIADQLGLSESTVKVHVNQILKTLQVKNRSQCQRRSKKRPPWRSKKGPPGGCGLVPVVHGRAPRATRRALNRLTRRCARGGPVGPRGQARAGWSVQFAVGV